MISGLIIELLVNATLSAKLLSFNLITDFFGEFQIGLSFINRQTVQCKKNRTAGLSQSNARKYNRQCNLAIQRKVPVTTRQKKFRWLTAVRRLTLLTSFCGECRFVLLLFCFGFLSGPFKRKMYDQTDETVCIGNNQRKDS